MGCMAIHPYDPLALNPNDLCLNYDLHDSLKTMIIRRYSYTARR